MGYRPPGQYGIEGIAQIELGGLDARLAEVLDLIVDAPGTAPYPLQKAPPLPA